jgi:hypothetical protein
MRRTSMDRLIITRRRSGDPCGCAKCLGKLAVQNTRVKEAAQVRVQYLACDLCNWRPEDNKVIIPLEFAPARAARQ